MSRTYHYPSRHAGRCRPRLERLEDRLALSLGAGPALPAFSISAFDTTPSQELGPYLTVVATDPMPGATLSQPINSVTVTFDRPLFAFSLTYNDIVIEQEQAGQWAPVFDPFSAPTEGLDPNIGNQLILTLPQALGPGQYRLVLPTGSMLSGADGSMINDPGYDQVLGDFTVAQPGVIRDQAQPLVGVGTSQVTVTGNLDLAANPGAVALYQINLPEGHHWRLGLQVSAQIDGSPLLSTLSLFDSTGHLLATGSLGRPIAWNDPYLFAGLAPGTYYVGLSGLGNVPGQPGGYNIAKGIAGVSSRPDAGGPFRLDIVADPADTAVRLIGFTPNWADPLSPAPTGLTLTFSGLLELDTLRGDPCPGFTLIGPDGSPVPMTAVGFSEQGAQYHFLFDQPLAPGRYTVLVPTQGGATDLAGLTPTGPDGRPGPLASFTVTKSAVQLPNNLGPLYNDVPVGKDTTSVLAPGATATYRFVALAEGWYKFSTVSSDPGATLALRLNGPNGSATYDATPPFQPGVYLEPGVYTLQLMNQSAGSVRVGWGVHRQAPWDSLLDNGVGQGPALNLRLVNPTTAPVETAPDVSVHAPSATVTSDPSLGGGLVMTLGNTPVGWPATNAERVVTVGPGAPGTVALAAAGAGLIPGIHFGQDDVRRSLPKDTGDDEQIAQGDGPATPLPIEAAPVDGAMVAAPAAGQAHPDEMVIAAADWIARFGRSALRTLSSQPDDLPDAEALPTDAPSQSIADDRGGALHGVGRIEQAHFDVPVVAGVMSVLAMRYHEPMVRWLRRNHAMPLSRRAAGSALPNRGPHRKP
jgi:hypothetical protein